MNLLKLQKTEAITRGLISPDQEVGAGVTFTPDGINLLTSSQNGASIRWGIPTETPLK